MRTGGTQALGRDLFKVALPGKEHGHRVVRHSFFLSGSILFRQVVQNLTATGLAVFFRYIVQFVDDDAADAGGLCQHIVQVGNVLFQLLDLAGALEDVFPVQVAQLDLCHIVGLHLVNAKADHQVGHHLGLLLSSADDTDGLVDIQQDGGKTLQQVQPLFLAVQVVVGAAAHALNAECRPLL